MLFGHDGYIRTVTSKKLLNGWTYQKTCLLTGGISKGQDTNLGVTRHANVQWMQGFAEGCNAWQRMRHLAKRHDLAQAMGAIPPHFPYKQPQLPWELTLSVITDRHALLTSAKCKPDNLREALEPRSLVPKLPLLIKECWLVRIVSLFLGVLVSILITSTWALTRLSCVMDLTMA